MRSDVYEFEVKASVSTTTEAIARIRAAGGTVGPSVLQHDVIFARSNDEILHPNTGTTILRIRTEAGRAVLTSKTHRTSELDCEEHEVVVSSLEAMTRVLQAIGLQDVLHVSKVRQAGRLGRFAVMVDQVEGLGAYVELELVTDDAPTDADRSDLASTLALITEDGAAETRGYDRLILELQQLER